MGVYSTLEAWESVPITEKNREAFNRIAGVLDKMELSRFDERKLSEEELKGVVKEIAKSKEEYEETVGFLDFWTEGFTKGMRKFDLGIFAWSFFYRLDKDNFIYLDGYDDDWTQKHYAIEALPYLIAYLMEPGRVTLRLTGEDGSRWGYVIERKEGIPYGKVYELEYEEYFMDENGQKIYAA